MRNASFIDVLPKGEVLLSDTIDGFDAQLVDKWRCTFFNIKEGTDEATHVSCKNFYNLSVIFLYNSLNLAVHCFSNTVPMQFLTINILGVPSSQEQWPRTLADTDTPTTWPPQYGFQGEQEQ